MRFDKEMKKEMMSDIHKYRIMDMPGDDVKKHIISKYGIKDITHLRKEYETLNRNMLIDTTITTSDTLDIAAKMMQKIMVQQKKTTIMKNELHKETRVEAFRERILDILREHNWKTYQSIGKVSKVPKIAGKHYKKGVIIVSDEHFRGNMDIKRLNTLYDSIEKQIQDNKYTEVELGYLGDGIDGLIHLGSLATNDGSIKPSVTYVNILIERVNKIPQVKAIKFVAQSNHSETRSLNSKRSELAAEDLNYTMLNAMHGGLRKDINLTSSDVMMFKYENIDFALIHGHQDYAKSRARLLEYGNSQYGYVPQVIIMGHGHNYKQTEYGLNKGVIVTPAVKMDDGNYERDKGFVSTGQYLIMEIVDKTPQIKIVTLER